MTTWSAEDDGTAPCWWPVADIACEDCDDPDPLLVELATQFAIEILWAATGRRFGLCTETIQPCDTPEPCPAPTGWPLVEGFQLYPYLCGGCGYGNCSCGRVEKLLLPSKRITEIVSVVIDGDTLDPAAYRLGTSKLGPLLIRVDGDPWPRCQDQEAEPGQPGSWEVTYVWGRDVPAGGELAAARLACEITKAVVCPDECGLPERVATVTRQGVTVGFLDPMSFLDQGLTGLLLVDYWIRAVNPHGVKKRPRVRRADAPKRGRLVRPASGGS